MASQLTQERAFPNECEVRQVLNITRNELEVFPNRKEIDYVFEKRPKRPFADILTVQANDSSLGTFTEDCTKSSNHNSFQHYICTYLGLPERILVRFLWAGYTIETCIQYNYSRYRKT